MIKTNMQMQHICVTDFAIWRADRTDINTLNLKVKVPFSQNDFASGLSILRGLST